MQTALVMMTILGCNDSVSQCQYIATAEQRWVSVALCNADSEKILSRFTNVAHPSVVAFCQIPEAPSAAVAAPGPGTPGSPSTVSTPSAAASPSTPTSLTPPEEIGPSPVLAEPERRSLAARAMAAIGEVFPDRKDLKMVFTAPVHVVSGSYAWVVKTLKPTP